MLRFFLLFTLTATSALAQIECPELDFCFPPTPGQNFTVPSPNFPTIESAVIAAPSGSTIRIGAGEYTANVTIDNKNLTILGNHAHGRPTIIQSASTELPIFRLNGSPSVKFRKLGLHRAAAAIQTDFAHNGPWASIQVSDLTVENTRRGIAGAYEDVKVDRSSFQFGSLHGISLSRVLNLEVRGSLFTDYEGVGLLVIGNQDSGISISGATFDNNDAGGVMIKNNRRPVILSKIRARNNGTAGIIVDHSGPVFLDRSELSLNRLKDGKFGNGLLVYSSTVEASRNNFISNRGFQTAMVGCGDTAANKYDLVFEGNNFFVPDATPPVTVFALYPQLDCTATPIGTLKDGGGNRCNGTSGCAAASAGGLEPISIEP